MNIQNPLVNGSHKTTESPLIEVKGLGFFRGEREIFKDLSLNIYKGKVTGIMGPSGTGKTTLLKLMSGQLKPCVGKVLVKGDDIHQLKRSQLYQLRRSMGMLFQSGALLTDLTVFENVAFPLREHASLPDEILMPLIKMKLQSVGLRGVAGYMPSELSGGMLRRVALARAIALDPEIVFYDEPFVGQDPITKGVLVSLIQKLNQSLKLTSVIVSHDVDEVLSIADYVYVISDGKVIAEGTPKSLLKNPNDAVKQFIKGEVDGPVPYHYAALDYSQDLRCKHSE